MRYVFGKDISREFNPEEGGQPLQIPSQTPEIYVYDSEPTRTDALAGTGSIASITSWSQLAHTPFTCTYTIPAIADTNSEGSVEGLWFYESIKFVTQDGEGEQLVIRAFFVELPRGNDSYPTVDVLEIKDNYPNIASYLEDEQISEFVQSAITELRGDLEAKGVEWNRVSELHKTKLAVAYKTIALCSFSQMKEPGDKFDRRYEEFGKKYQQELSKYKLPVDLNGDGKPDSIVTPQTSYIIIGR